MIWFGKSFIKFCKSFVNLIKLVSTIRPGIGGRSLIGGLMLTAGDRSSTCVLVDFRYLRLACRAVDLVPSVLLFLKFGQSVLRAHDRDRRTGCEAGDDEASAWEFSSGSSAVCGQNCCGLDSAEATRWWLGCEDDSPSWFCKCTMLLIAQVAWAPAWNAI